MFQGDRQGIGVQEVEVKGMSERYEPKKEIKQLLASVPREDYAAKVVEDFFIPKRTIIFLNEKLVRNKHRVGV